MNEEEALKKLKETELNALLAIASTCRKANIPWWLDSGTCLGAVRHQGFIPWDDDIDIGMLREDYDRFIRVAPEVLPSGYTLHTSRNTKGFAPLFAKVFVEDTLFETRETKEAGLCQGIFVDVFPYDNLHLDANQRKRQIQSASRAQYLSYLYHAKSITVPHKGALGKVESVGCRFVHNSLRMFMRSPEKLQDQFDNCALAPDSLDASNELITLVWPSMDAIRLDDIVPTKLASFEGHQLPVPGNVESYLEKMYGDWRQVPAAEDRHTHLPLKLVFPDGTIWIHD